jgi:hypothetical protein
MTKSAVSRNLSLHNIFQKLPRKSPKTTSNEKVATHKVVGNLLLMLLDKIRPKRTTEARPRSQLLRSPYAVSGFRKLVT